MQISNLKQNYFCFVFSCLIGKFTCKFQKISKSLLAGTKCYVKKARRFLFLTEKQPFSDKYQKLFSLTCCCFFQSVGFADEPPTWGHPPDPKVQSKSFKRLQKHLQEADEDGMYKVLEFFVLPLNSKVPPSQARVRPGSPTVI